MPKLCINHEGFQKACDTAGLRTSKAVARRMDIDAATLSRVTSGQSAPGSTFVAGALMAFGVSWFGDLFCVVP